MIRVLLYSAGRGILAALIATILPDLASAQALLSQIPITNNLGAVHAIGKFGNTVYVGGAFEYLGPPTGSAASLDVATGAPLAGFPEVNGGVRAFAPDGAGGWYIGGQFSIVGGRARNNLAHIKADLSVDDTWAPIVDGPVNALAVGGSSVYVGGHFFVSGTFRSLYAFDASTGAPLPFDASSSGTVNALALNGSTLHVGGSFSSIGGQGHTNLAALDATTGAALAWTADVTGSGVNALLLDGSTLYVGGNFIGISGFARNSLGAVDAGTAALQPLNPNVTGIVRALALNAGTLYAGGNFSMVGATSRINLAAISTATSLATAWNPGADSQVSALVFLGGTVYAGGAFKNAAGQPRLRIAGIDPSTAAATAWNPAAGDEVFSLFAAGSRIMVGGIFASVGGKVRNNLAAFDATTGAISSWDPGATGVVVKIVSDGTTVYVGGLFTAAGGQPRNNLAAISAATGLATSWNPNADGYVHDLALSGGLIYAAGEFFNVHTASHRSIVAINSGTGVPTTWNPGADNTVMRIIPLGGLIYAGGFFANMGGQARNGLAALSPTTALATAWDPSAAGVTGMTTDGTTMYLFGGFTAAGGALRNYFAGVDLGTGIATAFNPNPTSFPAGDLVVAGSKVYAVVARSGGPITIGGASRFVAELQLPGGSATTWNPSYTTAVFTNVGLLLDGSILYVGGEEAKLATPTGVVRCNLSAWDLSQVIGVGDETPRTRLGLALGPNPATGSTTIRLALPRDGHLRVRVFDVQGREVARLADGWMAAGARELAWAGTNQSGKRESGVYLVRAEAAGEVSVQRVVVFR
jgi:hypothetical protein